MAPPKAPPAQARPSRSIGIPRAVRDDPRLPAALGGPKEARPGPKVPTPVLDKGQKTLFVTWAAVLGLAMMQDVIVKKDWPCPGRYIKISALYLMLGVLGEVNSSLASMLGVGFGLAFLTRSATREIQKSGTFFGIKVK
jgi:hypothetical protein